MPWNIVVFTWKCLAKATKEMGILPVLPSLFGVSIGHLSGIPIPLEEINAQYEDMTIPSSYYKHTLQENDHISNQIEKGKISIQ